MIIDSPIVSGSFLSTGSLSQIGNATITGSLSVSGSSISLVNGSFSGSGANLYGIPSTGITGLNLSQISSGSVSASISPNLGLLINTSVSASNFTGSFTGSLTGIATSASYASFALTSSYSLGGSGFPFSGSAVITGSLLVSGSGVTVTGSLSTSGPITASGFLTTGTITAQTLVVSTVSSSVEYSSGSNIFGNSTANTQTFTGSVNISGSLNLNGAATLTNLTGSLFGTASWAQNFLTSSVTSASYAYTASSAISSYTASSAISASLSISASVAYSGTGSFTGSFVGAHTGSLFGTASWAQNFLTSSVATASYVNPLNQNVIVTGSLNTSGSVTITGSLAISTLTTGSGVRYVIADANGLISAQTSSAAIFTTQRTVATAGQTVFPITNGYSTGYVTVFVNGTKLSTDEYTDTSGTDIVFLTGSAGGNVVEFQKYLPASGVTNNSLRQVNFFTASLGQTNFTVNYTPGLIDVFYNGSKLDNTEYTAANGTSITLVTGSAAGDKLEVDVYSYQVGAFSGIGGTGAANQIAYYNTANSITGSNNFTVSGSAIIVTGSLIVSGSGTFTNIGPAVFSGSVNSIGGFTGSFTGSFFGSANSASLAQNSLLIDGTGSLAFATTASVATSSGSVSSRLTQIERVYATTGSNGFTANQSITGSLTVSSTITAQTLVIQTVTSSIIYSSGSNVFGCDINSRQTFTGSFYQTGSVANFSGQVCIGNATTGQRSLVVQAGSTNQAVMFKNASGGDATLYICGNATATHYGFNTYACADVLFIANGGSIGIGCNNPGYTLDVNGTGHFFTSGGTVLIESTQPTNSSILKLVQCANGGNGNTDQGLVVQTNAADATSNIAHFYDYNTGSPLSRMVIKKGGNVAIGCSISAGAKLDVWGNIRSYDSPTYYSTFDYLGGAYVEMASPSSETTDNFVFNICGASSSTTGNCFIFKTQTGNTTPSQVFGISKSGLVYISNNTCINGAMRSATVCSTSSTFFGSVLCGSNVRIGNTTFNTGYEGDGIWGTNATPNYISGTGYSSGFYLGYKDNGSGLYGAAYGFDVSYRDGNNNPTDYDAIVMRNSGQGTRPFRVTSYGNIYGNSKNFRIKHPIPSMNDTHYLVHTSIEAPQADLIYRGKVQLVNGKAEVNIDEASRMTNGTFELLCQDVQSYTTNESGWSLTKSYVVGNILHIEAQDETATDTISWLVIGERNDEGIKNSAITDSNGHVIVEELKPEGE